LVRNGAPEGVASADFGSSAELGASEDFGISEDCDEGFASPRAGGADGDAWSEGEASGVICEEWPGACGAWPSVAASGLPGIAA
jgi:hypothetical protein